MKRFQFFMALLIFFSCETVKEDAASVFATPFEVSEGKNTATYEEVINFYMALAKEFPEIHIQTIGTTDSGLPLHLVTYNPEAEFNFQKLRGEKLILMINNGIHPGESDGIDATMMLYRDLAEAKLPIPANAVLACIPLYNIGGSLNRTQKTRVNQNGPESYGFRGNARNFDLNRDFIKSDTRNTQTFSSIFHLVKPDIFIDTHVSNGADYQYSLSHLFTQHNKLGGEPGAFLQDKMIPGIEKEMEAAGIPLTPYVNVFNKPPETGFEQFMDYPRYSTGYAALWNTPGLMIESHMLKDYTTRVRHTYELLAKILVYADQHAPEILEIRQRALQRHLHWTHYPTQWEIDSSQIRKLQFKGYQADTITSSVTGLPRLKYRRDKPRDLEVNYYNSYKPTDSVLIPEAYILPRAWQRVVDRLNWNQINYTAFEVDTLIPVETDRILNYKTATSPYEGHYLHYQTQVASGEAEILVQAGDLYIPTDQAGIRYIMETLEPAAPDSFFNWNFFDTRLQQKEGFSPYVFEDLAREYLNQNPALRDSLEAMKIRDAAFREDSYRQLYWIYQQTGYYEAAYNLYPVFRLPKARETAVSD